MSIFLNDTFDEASSAYLDAHTANTGGAWVTYSLHSGWTSGTAQVIGGAGYLQFDTNLSTYRSPANPGDAFGQYDLQCSSDGASDSVAAIFGRWSSGADTGYMAMMRNNFGSNDIRLERYDAGVYNAGKSTGKSYTAWSTNQTMSLKFEDLGGGSHKISVLVDGVEELSVTDTAPIAGPGFVLVGGRSTKAYQVTADDGTAGGSIAAISNYYSMMRAA